MLSQNDTDSDSVATDCAVSIFARTFSPLRERQRAALFTPRGRKISNTLPFELLLLIFELAYEDVIENLLRDLVDCDSDDEEPDERPVPSRREVVALENSDRWKEHNLKSPSLFPYSLASVCSAWRDAMSLIPKFWKRVMILTDPPATPLSAIVSQLTWSRDRDLEVTVTRRNLDDRIKDPHKRSHMASIMKILCSQIHRIRELRFDVVFSSSLPCLITDFHGTATILERLHLQCKEDDGGPDCNEAAALMERGEFEHPKLRFLVIDGRNYYEASRKNLRWTRKIPKLGGLTISHFNPRPGESFITYDFLRTLTAFRASENIHIEDLALCPSPEHLRFTHFVQGISSLSLEDLHDIQVTEELVSALGCYELWLSRCTLGDGSAWCGPIFGEETVLHLEDIDQDPLPLLRVWNGYDLQVGNCPRFDDSVLDKMSSAENGSFICAPFINYLDIRNCQNISSSALRRLVESRLHLPPAPNFNHELDAPTSTQFGYLCVWGSVSPISEQGREWFAANVPNFVYHWEL